MVDLPTSSTSFSPYHMATAGSVLRSWAGNHGATHGFTYYRGTERGLDRYFNNDVQDAFRHNFVAAALYLDKYKGLTDRGVPHATADAIATRHVLRLGNLNEMFSPNELPNHLRDYHNNYEGVLAARDIVANMGADISNDELAKYIAIEVNASRAAPSGKGNIIIHTGLGVDLFNRPVLVADPRLTPRTYDLQRLPSPTWDEPGLNPQRGTLVPLPIMQAFPDMYGLTPTNSPPLRGGENEENPTSDTDAYGLSSTNDPLLRPGDMGRRPAFE
jgi:hypothetical protein